MPKRRTIILSIVAVGALWWIADSQGYPDRLFLPASEPYGVLFVKKSLGEETDVMVNSDYPEFCVLPAYFRTKDGKGTDDEREITFAICNASKCLASIETASPKYRGQRYGISTPRRKGFCVSDLDHITIEIFNDRGLILDHGGRAIWERT